jgi:hypothetical protein
MGLSEQQRNEIATLLQNKIRKKLIEYSPESQHMPFHVRLLGQDRMALFSFIHSINTMLGSAIFEQVAVIIARPHFKQVISQYKGLPDSISEESQRVIQRIMDNLETGSTKPNKEAETKSILQVAQTGTIKRVKKPCVDLFLQTEDGSEYYFDIKTAKPNIEGFADFKRKTLEWIAIRGTVNPLPTRIYTGLAIPYNPYEPKPYARWTLQGMFELSQEIKVAEEFWDFLGGKDTYSQLLEVFEQTGIQLRPEIDARFSQFAPSQGRKENTDA